MSREYLELTLGMSTARDQKVEEFYQRLFESYGPNVSGEIASIFKSRESAQAFLETVNEILEDKNLEGQGLSNAILREDAAARGVAMQNVVNELLMESTQQGLAALRPISLTSFGFQIRSYVKAAMHRAVKTVQAERPAFKITERKQYVIDIQGNKHYFVDAFNRNSNIINNLHQKFNFTVNVPTSDYDIFTTNSIDPRNKLAVDIAVKSFTAVEPGEDPEPAAEETLKIIGRNRQIDIETGRFSVDVQFGSDNAKATIMGEIDFESAKLVSISSTSPRITTVTFAARLSSETHLKALVTGFEHKHTNVVIPDGAHIEVNPSVEFIDDVNRMLGVNALEEYTNQMGQLVEQLEDRSIYEYLKDLESQAILTKDFNVTPDAGFSLGREEWLRREFHPFIERICIRLKAELQLDDCHFRVVGNPIDIRVPNASGEQYIFRRNQDMTGASQVNYDFAVMSTGMTIFYLSTDRVAPGKIYINLIPNSIQNNMITINHYRYANYVSNKYRSSVNPALPAIMVSSRYQTKEYYPVMAVVNMQNNYSDYYQGFYLNQQQ